MNRVTTREPGGRIQKQSPAGILYQLAQKPTSISQPAPASTTSNQLCQVIKPLLQEGPNPTNPLLMAKRDWERLGKEAGFKPARMALLCSMCERQLQRTFKKHFHRTPRSWLRQLQCRLAKGLIEQGYSTKAAAAELNFATEAHFCREFKKIYGASPQCFGPNQSGSWSESGLAHFAQPRNGA